LFRNICDATLDCLDCSVLSIANTLLICETEDVADGLVSNEAGGGEGAAPGGGDAEGVWASDAGDGVSEAPAI